MRYLTMVPPVEPWAGIDEGHVAMEVQASGVWLNFDPNNGAYYRDAGGIHRSARDISASIAGDTLQVSRLDADAGYEAIPFEATKFDATGWKKIVFHRDGADGFRLWLRRIMQAVGWDHPSNGETWWLLPAGSEGRASWVLGLSPTYRVKIAAEIAAQFYP